MLNNKIKSQLIKEFVLHSFGNNPATDLPTDYDKLGYKSFTEKKIYIWYKDGKVSRHLFK